MNLDDIFDSLSTEQRLHLLSSFDKLEPCFLEYETGKFLGCHLISVHFTVLGRTEYWCWGVSP